MTLKIYTSEPGNSATLINTPKARFMAFPPKNVCKNVSVQIIDVAYVFKRRQIQNANIQNVAGLDMQTITFV